jgi:hypothetical protein
VDDASREHGVVPDRTVDLDGLARGPHVVSDRRVDANVPPGAEHVALDRAGDRHLGARRGDVAPHVRVHVNRFSGRHDVIGDDRRRVSRTRLRRRALRLLSAQPPGAHGEDDEDEQ